MSLSDRWHARLIALHEQGRHRRLMTPAGIDLCSNDYLCFGGRPIADDPRRASRRKPDVLPHSGLASRLLRGHHPLWDEVEAALADWHGAETALMFTSGYVANEGLLAALVEPGDFVASDAANHASIIDGLRLTRGERFVFRHNDLGHLEEGLRGALRQPRGERFIIVESLFGMDGDRAPLVELAALARRYDANLIVDEAHATGCFGPRGSGLVDELGLRAQVLATVHTGGKALGVPGAYVAGARLLKDYLINHCRHLMFTTALPPQVAAWWLEAHRRACEQDQARQALHENAMCFRAALVRHGVVAPGRDYIVPVLLGDDRRAVAAARRLQEQGYDIRAIRPPTVPEGTARLRISIHADHEPKMLEAVAVAVACSPLAPREVSGT
jgi:8-amino-7-oxononanoate synthase